MGKWACFMGKNRLMPRQMIETIRPRSRDEWLALRKGTVGFSEVPALFGVHDHLTPFELFAIKSGTYQKQFARTEIRENSIHLPPVERGNFVESKAFELTRMLRPAWTVVPNQIPGGDFFVDREARMSCTPDAFLQRPDRNGRGALQIKNMIEAVFNRDWKLEDGFEPPLSVAIQAIGDAVMSGCSWACAGALIVGFNVDFYLFEIDLNSKIMNRARELIADFWRRILDHDPYPPDYLRDVDVIKSIYANDDGGEVDLSGNERAAKIIAAREGLKRIEAAGNAAEKERKILDAELIHILGNATHGRLADGLVVEAKAVRRAGFTVAPTSFRTVMIKGEPRAAYWRSNGDDRSQQAAQDNF